jgi:hypothetical protein
VTKLFLRSGDIHNPRIKFDITKGFIDDLADFRGENDEVPEAAGREWMPKEEDRRPIELGGGVYGIGATHLAKQEDYLRASRELADLLDAIQEPGELLVVGPYRGVPAGQTVRIDVEYAGANWGELTAGATKRRGVVLLEATGSPPDWAGDPVTLATSAAADDIVDTATPHGFAVGNRVRFPSLTGGAGLTVDVVYYVIAASLGSTTFQVSATKGGTAVNFTTNITAGTVERLY